MEIKRFDIYLVGLVILHMSILWRVLLQITQGSALQMMSIPGGFGYAVIAIFVAIFTLSFFNLSHMFRIATRSNSVKDVLEVTSLQGTSQRFLVILLMYVFLESVLALHLMGMIGY